MLVLSLNARGLGSSPKLKSLRRMIDIKKPVIIFIQETMMEGEKAKKGFGDMVERLEFWPH